MVETRCCQEDHKTLKGYIEHYLNVHGGVVPFREDRWPDHDHRHFKCCGQFHHGEADFRRHVARAHADVDVDEIRELAPELLGIEPDLEEDEPEEADEGDEDETPDEAGDDDDDAAEEADGDEGEPSSAADLIDESELEGLSGKERAIKKAKLIAQKKKQQSG